MAILPDDIRAAQDQERRAAREAARTAAGLHPHQPRRVGIERPRARGTGRSSFRVRRSAPVSSQPVREPVDLDGGTPCECGCGLYPMRRSSRFRPGHDSKLRARETATR